MKPGNLVLRQSVLIKTLPFLTFHIILEILRVEWWNSMTGFASLPERGNENI